MKKKTLLITMVLSMAIAMTVGCGKKEDTPKKETTKTVDTKTANTKKIEEKAEVLKTIGEKSGTSFEVKLTNNASQDITGIAIKSSDDQVYPENMLKNADKFIKAESRNVYYTPAKAKEAATATGKVIPIEYSVQLTFADGTVSELHAFPFEDIQEGKINLEEKMAFISYTSIASKQEVVTLEAEKAVKAQVEAAVAAQAQAEKDAAAAKAAADAAAQVAVNQTAQPQPADTTPQYQPEQPEVPAPEAPAPEAPAPAPDPVPDAGADEGEGCLDDGLFY